MHPTELIDRDSLRDDVPSFSPGDTVKVHVRVVEGTRERVQVFQGVVLRRQGTGLRETFSVRKVSAGVGVERKLRRNITGKIEYDYLDYGTKQVLFTFPGIGSNGANVRTQMSELLVGISYLLQP